MNEKGRILIVDDDEGTREILTLIFGKKGYEIETAATGQEAIEKAHGGPFNAALIDIKLPDIKGLELLAPLRELYPDIALILITGHASLQTAVQALDKGALAYITKPLKSEEVLVRVRDALEKQRLIEERQQALEALERRAKQLAALGRATQAVTASLNLAQVLSEIVSLAGEVVATDYTSVVLVDEAGDIGESAEDVPGIPAIEYRIRDEGLTRWIVRSRQAVLVDEVGTDGTMTPDPGEGAPRSANPSIMQAGVKSLAGLPLIVKGRLLGVLYVHSLRPGTFRNQLPLLSTFANQVAIAIENARLYQAARQEITERKRAEEALQQSAEQLHALAARLAEAEELERQQIARELHDQVGQNLTALGINLNIVRSQIPEEAAATALARLDDSLALVEQTAERIRHVMADLRPPVLDDYGLMAALRWYGEQFTSRTGLTVTVQGEKLNPRLAAHVENGLFRIAQEALTNVSKHAQAGRATVTLEVNGETVRLVVADDGIGFDAVEPDDQPGWGLLTMAERAEAVDGSCRVESRPGKGTRVVVEVAR
jgi:signal transduction histidine kinase